MATAGNNRLKTGLVLTTLALCALFLAQGATAVLAAKVLRADSTDELARPRRRAAAPLNLGRRDSSIILERNIFDSSLGDLTQIPLEGPQLIDDDLSWDESQVVNRCKGSLRLIGTVVVPGELERSLAAIEGADQKAGLHRGGAAVEGSRIRAIHSDSVVLQPSSGGLCRLRMFEVEGAAKAPPKVAAKTPKPRRPVGDADRNVGLTEQEMAEGIDKVNDTNFNIQRSMLNKVLDNAGRLIGIAAISPKHEGGQVIGMQIKGIRSKTLLTKLGIRNGDILQRVNGRSLSSPDAALEAYTTLQTADKFNLAIKRGGRSMTINYNVQ